MKSKPDFILILLVIFAMGVLVTLLMPMSATRSVAEPVSALQAGVLSPVEVVSE